MIRNRRGRFYLLLIIAILLAGCNDGAPETVPEEITPSQELVKEGLPMIDGILSPGEWDQAVIENFEDGSEVYLLQSGEYLYLAIRAIPSQMIAGNVFLNEGDRITIHHTSAALGTAIYQEDNNTWRKIEDFNWCCRSRIETDTEAREDFFDRDGWLGINSFLGNENELEYQIRFSESVQSIAVKLDLGK